MGDSSQKEVIPQQEVDTESIKRSKLCIGWNSVMMTLPNTVTGVTIVVTQPVTNDTLKRTQLVTNTTLKITQGMQYNQHSNNLVALLYYSIHCYIVDEIVTT